MGEFVKDPGGGMGMYDPGIGWEFKKDPGGMRIISSLDPRTGV